MSKPAFVARPSSSHLSAGWLCGLLASLSACDGEEGRPPEPVRTDSAGVDVVSNPPSDAV